VHAGLRRDDRVITNLLVSSKTGLASSLDVAPQLGRACQTDLCRQNRILTHLGSVADLNEVVKLGAAVDPGISDRCPVNGRVGPDLDIVFNHNAACLANLVIRSIAYRCEAESVAADDGAVLYRYPVTDLTELANHDTCMQNHIISNADTRVEYDMRMKSGASTEFAPAGNDHVGTDAGTWLNPSILRYDR